MRLAERQRDLAARHLHLVRPIATQARRHLPKHVEVDDLIGHGVDGLLQAAARFEPSRGLSFATFATYRIRGAIYDAIRAECRHRDGRREHAVWFAISAGGERTDEAIDLRRAAPRLHRALASLTCHERGVLHDHYFEDRALSHAGGALGISRSWASRLHARSLEKLRNLLAIEAA